MQTTEKYNWEKKVRGKKSGEETAKKYKLKVIWEVDANKQRGTLNRTFIL